MNENTSSSNSNTTTALALSQSRQPETFRPHYTSRYDNEAWEVAVSLPGAKKDDVKVTVENEILEIEAVRHTSVPESWRPLGDYPSEKAWRLRLDVGPEVDGGRISAALEDGVLTLRLPLREELKPRRIEIL